MRSAEVVFFFSSRRRHTRYWRDWSSDVCSSDLPYITLAGAAFALIYAHRQKDLIPDFVPEFGHADESAVVRAVLIEHEKVLAGYASRHQLNWPKLTVNP